MQFITKTSELESACARLSRSAYITVDTEFMRETTFWPKLCLIQMADERQEMLVDALAPGLDLASFYDLMANLDVTKVFHAARQDIEIIYIGAGVIPAPLFDTQVAAMVCGFGDQTGYETLAKKLANAQIDKTARFTDWSRRPLTKKQMAYALADVTHLRDVYKSLKSTIDRSGRNSWLDEEMGILTTVDTYVSHPEDAWQRLKLKVRNKRALGVLVSLAEMA